MVGLVLVVVVLLVVVADNGAEFGAALPTLTILGLAADDAPAEGDLVVNNSFNFITYII